MGGYSNAPEDNLAEVKVKQLISLALWSIRRIPDEKEKLFVYEELLKVVGNNDDYRKFIEDDKA